MSKKETEAAKKADAKAKKLAAEAKDAAKKLAKRQAKIAPNWTLSPIARAIDLTATVSRTGRAIEIDDLYAFALPGEPVVSPDGTKVVTSVTTIDREANEYRSALWLIPLDGSATRKLTSGQWSDGSPRWSPDGQWIAFTSNRTDKTANIWVLPTDGGEAQQVTSLTNGAGEISWAPDSRRIAFTSRVDPERPDGTEESDVKVITSARYRFDGRGYLGDKVSHVFIADITTPDAAPIQLTSGHVNHTAPAWSPAGTEIAFVANREPNWDLSTTSDIWTIAATGGEPRRLTPGKGEFASPVWSPDGTQLAAIGVRKQSPIVVNRQLWVMSATGEHLRSISADVDRAIGDASMSGPGGAITTAPIAWTADGSAIDSLVGDRGSTVVVRFPLDGSGATQIAPSGRHISAFAQAGDDLIVTASDPTTPFELRRLSAEGESFLTSFNTDWLAEVGIATPEEFWVTSKGEAIQGWLLRPAGNTPTSEPVPLILNVHGGPHGQFSNAFFHELQLYAAKGYALVYINPRGSVGYGEKFAQGVSRAWGEADMPDFMAAVDHVLTLGGLDGTRLGVTGGSYGGFTTNWLLGHTDRFKVAVTDRSISNLISMYGTDDITLSTFDPEHGMPWENVKRFWELSPLKYVANVTAPCLIIHSENDFRCPMEQAEQWYFALKRLGRDTKFVRFPNESHGLGRNGQPKHRVERLDHTLDWFATWI